jgi:hypothetical protein
VVEEVQIVNGDDLRRSPRGHQQRVRRVRDIDGAAGQHLSRWPAQPVPRQIQDAHRHSPIDQGNIPQLANVRQAVFPRARKEGDFELGQTVALRQAPDELVSVLAGAGPFAESRPVIDQDAHLFKSFRVSILL